MSAFNVFNVEMATPASSSSALATEPAVKFGANAVTIDTLGQGGQTPTLVHTSPEEGFNWVDTFRGNGGVGNSIANGENQIVVNASTVSAASGPGAPGLAGNDTESAYRLYGDTVGNGHYRVKSFDSNAFLGEFNILAHLDTEDNGQD
jgi:hypothetical protein